MKKDSSATAEPRRTRDGPCYFCARAWAGMRPRLTITKRQSQILQCVLVGYSEARTATILRISPSTVRTHMERIREKVGVHPLAALVARLFEAHDEWRREGSPPSGCRWNCVFYESGSSS